MRKKGFKKFIEWHVWISIRFLSDMLACLPLSWNYALGYFIGNLVFLFDKKSRRISLKNLKIAFPEKSEQERKFLAKQFCLMMLQSFFEVNFFLKHPKALSQIEVEGIEYLDQALKEKKGIIGLTGHFGNFILMHFKLAHLNFPVAVMTRQIRNKHVNNHYHGIRDKLNIKTIYTVPKLKAISQTIKSLRSNDLVIIQMDQDFREQGVWVNFFDRPASTAPGPVVFSLRTQAVILPMFIIREGKGKHRIKIYPPYQIEITENREQTVIKNVQNLTKIIEGWIQEYPQQWGWVNDRWKTRPMRP